MAIFQEVRTALLIGGAFMVVTLPASAQSAAPTPVVAVQAPVQPAPAIAPKPTRFLMVDGIAGESIDAAHPGWIEIGSFQWGTTPASAPSGAGSRVARTGGVSSFVFTKNVDKASAALHKAAVEGSHIKTVVLDLVSHTKGEYYQATMSDVLVSSYRANAGQTRPTESMTLNFAKLDIKYGKVDPQGIRGALQRVPANWDIRLVVPN
jgi:type VI secretion system Hcp family effector